VNTSFAGFPVGISLIIYLHPPEHESGSFLAEDRTRVTVAFARFEEFCV